jgi:GNAT superfamily N-acetyltransferase
LQVTAFQLDSRTFHIRQAAHAEADQVLSLLRASAEWLQARGTRWEPYLDGAEGQLPIISGAIDRSEVYLLSQDERNVGTISLALDQSEWDRQIWGALPDDAAYVHRLTVDRNLAGLGLGGNLLDFAEACGSAAGKRYLRLDCPSDSLGLNAYYLRRYRFVGESPNFGLVFSKYEKTL